MNNRFAVVVFALLLIGSLPAGIAGAVTPLAAAEPTGSVDSTGSVGSSVSNGAAADRHLLADADDVMHRTTTLRHLPDDPDVFEVETTFEIPEPMSGLEIDLEDGADVQSHEGFEATGEGTYRWIESTDTPTIRYTMPADRTGDVDYDRGERDVGGGYTFVDTGDWGIVPVPDIGLTRQSPEGVTIGLEETVTVDGPGAVGSDVAFFGPVTEYERTVDEETIRLVVPDVVDLAERPEDVLEELAAASTRLEVGASSPEVFVVAVPSDVDWGQRRGIQYGRSDAWVVADAELEEASNVWLHEYVHARQAFANPSVGTETEVRWLVEGQAEYYAGLLAYERGLISFSEFREHVERGERSPYADGVLAEPSTWNSAEADYAKGALVYGELDRQMRLATDGDRTLEDVFRQLNARDERVSESDVLAALEDAGGEQLRESAVRYTRTAETPDAWGWFEHRAAFDQSAATVEYELDADSIEVGGQPWTRWDRDEIPALQSDAATGDTGTDRGVLAVPAGETVTVPVAMEIRDDRAGTADATLQVDGTIVDYERRALKVDERATTALAWTTERPGVHDVRVGSDRQTVFVRSSPSLTVTDLRVDPETVEPGESVTATATVTNDDGIPAAGALPFRTADGPTIGSPVALAPGETGTVEVELTFDDEGKYEVVAGHGSATVTVGGILATAESMPGFGVAAGIVGFAVALSVAVLGRRYRRY